MADEITIDLFDNDENDILNAEEIIETALSQEPTVTEPNPSESEPQPNNNNEEDFTTAVLRLKGISDPTKIKFEDASGAIVERSWDDLTENEQLNIIAGGEDPERDLDNTEIDLINAIRESGLDVNSYLASIQQLAVQQYQSLTPRSYAIDTLSDDELYALDLMEKVENITDEEMNADIALAKLNPDLYQKKITALRTQYKALEEEKDLRAQEEQSKVEEARYLNFHDSIIHEIEQMTTFAGENFELTEDDMNDIANFILTRDDTGITEFGRMLNDPKNFTLAATWALKGPEIVEELKKQTQEAFQRGFNAGQKLLQNRVTVQSSKPSTAKKNQNVINLWDESYLG